MTRRYLTLAELQQQPPYCGFVQAEPLSGLRYQMLLVNGDDAVAMRWHWNRAYEPMALSLWCALAAMSEVCIDVGAHTGAYTLAARVAAPSTHTVSFEPHSLNFARLVTNLRANSLASSNVFSVAISDRVGVAPFSISASEWYHSTGSSIGERAGSAVTRVRTTTLDVFRQQISRRVGLIKIDVEGHEAEVIRGGAATIAGDAPDIILESTQAEPAALCSEILRGLGYAFYLVDDKNLSVSPVPDLSPFFGADGAPDMDRLNRLATRRSQEEIARLIGGSGPRA